MKAIYLLQKINHDIFVAHQQIGNDIDEIKKSLSQYAQYIIENKDEFNALCEKNIQNMSHQIQLPSISIDDIYIQSEKGHNFEVTLSDILSIDDFEEAQRRVNRHVLDFNKRYNLDGWDYAIAGGCGLFAAMLDLLCVNAPSKPTVSWSEQVNGVFNQWVQKAFNGFIHPDLSKQLSRQNTIGAPDSSTIVQLLGAPAKALNPINHRLRAMSHDPILGLIFGVWDMLHGTWTGVIDGKIISIPGKQGPIQGNIFQLIGRMLGHLLSDINAPSMNNNRGMGLPAPFMGLLRMFDNIHIGDSTFDKQVEWMYANGYDFRQFLAGSIPLAIMEILTRFFYILKQVNLYDAQFSTTVLDTMPSRMNPRFRMIIASSYGVVSAINAGKCYITKNILNANYAAWMGLTWNGFHALKWSLLDRHFKLWAEVEAKEIADLENLIKKIDMLEQRACNLPI
jgi:hypothetical protein